VGVSVKFFLGTHHPHWLERTDVPLFVSRRWLANRKKLPIAQGPWVLDSGGFTELSLYGEWRTHPMQYVTEVQRFSQEVGRLEWVAPQDWMCEPFMLAKTGKSIEAHQYLTVASYRELQEHGLPVIPVLQGWDLDDYLRCAQIYEDCGVSLVDESVVGLGSVCRRQNMATTGAIIRRLAGEGFSLHGFGVKLTGLESYGDCLVSADSMAWSYRARHDYPLKGCTHKSCANCLRYALRWRTQVLARLGQMRLEVVA
jgi:hypothetical protein